LIDAVRDVLDDFPGTSYAFTQPIEMRVSEMLTGTRGDLAVKIFGPDLTTLNQLAAQIETLLNGIDGAQDVYTLTNEGVQYLEVSPDRQRAGARGVDVVALQETLRAQVEGMPVGTVVQEGRRIPLMIRGDDTLRSDPERFADLPVVDASGSAIRVSDIATVRRVSGPVKVDRENASRFAVVQANVSGRDLVGYVDEAKAAVVAQLQVPPGYRITWGGQFENQQRAAARLGLVVPIALAGIFLVLFSSLGSVRQASLILANIPFALVGGVIALWLTGEYLSVPAAVGFIALLGIAVLNGLVMVAYMNQLRAAGHSALEAVTLGAQRRLRPVLMTASITAFGLVPLLLASGPGSEIQKPLAIVVIGGLLSATVLTLLLLPLLYLRFSETRATAKEITP
jgi:cobalt-zinc-cadmium resistance protein CzcA